MLLVLGEKLVGATQSRSGDEPLHLQLDQVTVASILGACILNRGLHLVPDVSSGALRALNVLSDMPALEYKFRDAAATTRAELAAALDAWHDGGRLEQRRSRVRRAATLGVPPRSVEALRMALEDFESEHGVRFSFAAPALDVPAPLLDEAASAQLRALGVETFVFGSRGDDNDGANDAEVWASLAGDLMHYLDAIVTPLVGDDDQSHDETKPRRAAAPTRSHVFISYSHHARDTHWKDELLTHLAGFDRLIDVWVDTRIGAGKDWEKEIRAAMARARVGVFLVSPSFLASKFIKTVERQETEGMEIMPVMVRACPYKPHAWLKPMQIRPKDATPIDGLSSSAADSALAAIAMEIYGMCYPIP